MNEDADKQVVLPPVEDPDDLFCPCGGPPCQTPIGHGCGVRTWREIMDDLNRA